MNYPREELKRRDEYTNENIGDAYLLFCESDPGLEVRYVGFRSLAEEFVTMAKKDGLNISLRGCKEGFGLHVFTLVSRKVLEKPQEAQVLQNRQRIRDMISSVALVFMNWFGKS